MRPHAPQVLPHGPGEVAGLGRGQRLRRQPRRVALQQPVHYLAQPPQAHEEEHREAPEGRRGARARGRRHGGRRRRGARGRQRVVVRQRGAQVGRAQVEELQQHADEEPRGHIVEQQPHARGRHQRSGEHGLEEGLALHRDEAAPDASERHLGPAHAHALTPPFPSALAAPPAPPASPPAPPAPPPARPPPPAAAATAAPTRPGTRRATPAGVRCRSARCPG